MKEVTESTWMKRTEFDNGFTKETPKPKYYAIKLAASTVGGVAMYGLGSVAGEIVEYIPYLNEWIPTAVDYVSGIDVSENISGLVGLLGGVYGLMTSGPKLNENTLELEKVVFCPLEYDIRRSERLKLKNGYLCSSNND